LSERRNADGFPFSWRSSGDQERAKKKRMKTRRLTGWKELIEIVDALSVLGKQLRLARYGFFGLQGEEKRRACTRYEPMRPTSRLTGAKTDLDEIERDDRTAVLLEERVEMTGSRSEEGICDAN
jgi:hypothetical protein